MIKYIVLMTHYLAIIKKKNIYSQKIKILRYYEKMSLI